MISYEKVSPNMSLFVVVQRKAQLVFIIRFVVHYINARWTIPFLRNKNASRLPLYTTLSICVQALLLDPHYFLTSKNLICCLLLSSFSCRH
jgi:hypothetical protein